MVTKQLERGPGSFGGSDSVNMGLTAIDRRAQMLVTYAVMQRSQDVTYGFVNLPEVSPLFWFICDSFHCRAFSWKPSFLWCAKEIVSPPEKG